MDPFSPIVKITVFKCILIFVQNFGNVAGAMVNTQSMLLFYGMKEAKYNAGDTVLSDHCTVSLNSKLLLANLSFKIGHDLTLKCKATFVVNCYIF